MKAARFMSKPFFTTGFQVTTENMSEVARWCRGHVIRDNVPEPFILVPVANARNKAQSEAHITDYILKSEQGVRTTFRIYTEEWLHKKFFLFDGIIPDLDEIPSPIVEVRLAEPIPSQSRAVIEPHPVDAAAPPSFRAP